MLRRTMDVNIFLHRTMIRLVRKVNRLVTAIRYASFMSRFGHVRLVGADPLRSQENKGGR